MTSKLMAAAALMIAMTTHAFAAPKVGEPAPDFTATDSNGKVQKLSQYKGKYVVLEWFNHGCPFVGKHYGAKNMQALQKKWTGKGVVWLSINSSAPGKEGHTPAAEANKIAKEKGAAPTAILLDPKGEIGHLYAAKTTPHMFVVDPKGQLIYAGAIDSVPSTDEADVAKATNYVSQALEEAMAGKKVTVATTKSYGCGVKYE